MIGRSLLVPALALLLCALSSVVSVFAQSTGPKAKPATLSERLAAATAAREADDMAKAKTLIDQIVLDLATFPVITKADQDAIVEEAARTYRDLKDLPKATALYTQLVGLRRAAVPINPGKLAAALDGLGGQLTIAGQGAAAIALHEEALSLVRSTPNPDQSAVARALAQRANAHRSLDQLSLAEPLYRQALAAQLAATGQNKEALTIMQNLSVTLSEMDKNAESWAMSLEILEIRRNQSPRDEAALGTALHIVGQLTVERGKEDEGIALMREGLAMRRKALPANHPSIAVSLRDLVDPLLVSGKIDEAYGFAKEAYEITRNATGPDSPQTAESLSQLASATLFVKGLEPCLQLLDQAIAIRLRIGSYWSSDLAISRESKADLLRFDGQFANAYLEYRTAGQELLAGPGQEVSLDPNARVMFQRRMGVFVYQLHTGWKAAHK